MLCLNRGQLFSTLREWSQPLSSTLLNICQDLVHNGLHPYTSGVRPVHLVLAYHLSIVHVVANGDKLHHSLHKHTSLSTTSFVKLAPKGQNGLQYTLGCLVMECIEHCVPVHSRNTCHLPPDHSGCSCSHCLSSFSRSC